MQSATPAPPDTAASPDPDTVCLSDWLIAETGIPESGARQLATYLAATYKALGVIPSQRKIVLERFFDESGGMQLVIHSPFGARLNRAWGLALRKRFCRSFNFELQAAATDDAIVLSLGTQHSFPLDEVFRYLHSKSVREVLVQALLDAPMFGIRWRWNASRALALPRHRGGRRIPAPLQRMESENLLAAVFPDQLACLENIAGDREVPDHPLVQQTIEDCLTEAMDIDGLEALLRRIENGEVQCIARDLPEPSPIAHEILNARPYAFLDDAPLEERRTQAVYTRRASDASSDELGILDQAAIDRVCEEAWPRAINPDELHEALLLLGVMSEDEATRCTGDAPEFLEMLATQKRAGQIRKASQIVAADVRRLTSTKARDQSLLTSAATVHESVLEKQPGRLAGARRCWVAAERLPMLLAVYPGATVEPPLEAPEAERKRSWERADAVRELVRGRIEAAGPITGAMLADFLGLPLPEIDVALLALEAEGFVLRGRFHRSAPQLEWCDRRLLARIHRLTLNRLRAEIQPVSIADFQRFLLAWQRVDAEHRAGGPEGVEAVLTLLDGYELPAAAWEPDVLAMRVHEYTPQWLDQLCFTGRIGWGRLSPPHPPKARAFAPLRSSPICLFARENLPHWLALSAASAPVELAPDTESVLNTLAKSGAMFFSEIVRDTCLLPSRVEQALGELAALGWATADSFEGLRALLTPAEKRVPFADVTRKRRHKAVTSVEFAGRWALLRTPAPEAAARFELARPLDPEAARREREVALDRFARVLLRRYGIMFRRLLEREALAVSWFELVRIYRRLEARGEIRGGHFVSGVGGEQFALPEAIGLVRSLRKKPAATDFITLSAADPLNLVGILTPGPRLAAIVSNRLVLRSGVPLAALVAGEILHLDSSAAMEEQKIEHALRVGSLPAALRPYYA